MQIAVLILMAGVVGGLIITLVRLSKSDFSLLANKMAKKTRDNFEVLKPCPLCGSMLRKGETVHSVVFSGGSSGESKRSTAPRASEDYLAHLFGCPYCYPANHEHPRKCPVCEKTVRTDGFVIARMFEKPGRKHVHVLGCTECRAPSQRKGRRE